MASSIHERAPPRAQRSTRRKRSYRELTYDDELSDTPSIHSQRPAARSSKRVQRQSYREDGDSTDASQSASYSAPPRRSPLSNTREAHIATASRRSPRNTPAMQHKGRAPSAPSSLKRDLLSTKRAKLSNAIESRDGNSKQKFQEQSPVNKIIPPWQDLEYQVLLQILKYAAYPLYIGASHSRPTIHWLLDVSLLSKSFRAAAIAALLYCPPLFPVKRAHGLLRLLRRDQDTLSTNYRTKIRAIHVEAKNLLMKKNGVVLQDLVGQHTPLLSEMNIYHNFDLIGPTTWGRASASKRNWVYPLELFDVLDDADIRLKAFSWNGRFPDTTRILERMPSLHERPSLHSLRSLSIMNLTMPEKSSEAGIEGLLTSALLHLPELKELAFENCELLSEAMLAKLPHGLRSLTLTTCAKVTSRGLDTFLDLHGHELENIYLKGNQALDLGFLPALASSCPNLDTIEVDLTYTDPSSYHDIDPHYDELLPNGLPTWPASVRVVEFANLRNLNAAEAEGFFQSLVDAAPDLKNLRRLILKAILKIGWRDRARLRGKWKAKFQEVFKRTSHLPLSSDPSSPTLSSEKAAGPLIESCVAVSHTALPGEDSDSAEKASRTMAKNRKSSRIAQKELGSLSTASIEAGRMVHGMVDEVVLRLDDQRPAESQFNEEDFLDSERSDVDWDGT